MAPCQPHDNRIITYLPSIEEKPEGLSRVGGQGNYHIITVFIPSHSLGLPSSSTTI